MTTMIFVHGTGVRKAGYDKNYDLIAPFIREIGCEPARCLWGDPHGSKFIGAALPGYESEAEREDIALWQLLLQSPFSELMLLEDRSTVYRQYPIDHSDSLQTVVIDAKQRAIIAKRRTPAPSEAPNVLDAGGSHNSGDTVVCSEPSPDALAAISDIVNASLKLDATAKNGSATLGSALSESVGQLQRARTIQLLRDEFLSACLGYANGALTASQYRSLVRKYSDGVVTLLGIEQLTPEANSTALTLNSPGTQPGGNGSQGDGSASGADQSKGSSDGNSGSSETSPEKTPTADRDPGLGTVHAVPAMTRVPAPRSAAPASLSKVLLVASRPSSPSGSSRDTPPSDPNKEKPAVPGTTAGSADLQPGATPSEGGSSPSGAVVTAVQFMVSRYLTSSLAQECIEYFGDPDYMTRQAYIARMGNSAAPGSGGGNGESNLRQSPDRNPKQAPYTGTSARATASPSDPMWNFCQTVFTAAVCSPDLNGNCSDNDSSHTETAKSSPKNSSPNTTGSQQSHSSSKLVSPYYRQDQTQ